MKLLYKPNVEPVIFLTSVALGILLTVNTAFIYWKLCMRDITNSNFNNYSLMNEYCINLEQNSQNSPINSTIRSQENYVQQESARYALYSTICTCVPAIMLSLFCGAWSDKYGRKPLLVLNTVGATIAYLPIICSATYTLSSPLIFLIGSLIFGITGGPLIQFMTAFSMITDQARKEDEKILYFRLGVGSSMLMLGILIGSLICGVMLKHGESYVLVFLVSSIISALSVIYAVLFVNETVHLSKFGMIIDESSTPTQLTSCCDVTFVRDSMSTLTRPRSGGRRMMLLTSLLAYNLVYATDMGMPGLMLLYLKRPPLEWSNSEYSYLNALMAGMGGIGMILIPLVTSFLNFPDILSGVIALSVLAIKGIMIALVKETSVIFIVACGTLVSASFYPAMRTFITRLVERDEVGRIFAAIASAESIAPLVAGVIFSNLYAASVDLFDGLVFIVASVVQIICCFVFLFLYTVDKRRRLREEDELNIIVDDIQ